MKKIDWCTYIYAGSLCISLLFTACSGENRDTKGKIALQVPRGYVPVLIFEHEDQRYFFGPFTGYYFRPSRYGELEKLIFVCFNEQGFYTDSLPHNTLLYEGEAVFQKLPGNKKDIPKQGERIRPVFFDKAPSVWLSTRPEPQTEYVHFHSGYNKQGAALLGYWLRHRAMADFTYNMGGRLTPDSILYHRAAKGIDHDFARIIEFDMGPGS
ncbi:MAG: hypothetical protein KQH63_18860 [Desulfobulbaceae bacterium]|nr:hypothetical protein [Desulfobulbaceae bacterium]